MRVFVSSSADDEKLKRDLLKHLAPAVRAQRLEVWHSGKVIPGDEITSVTEAELERADIALVLLSGSYLAPGNPAYQDLMLIAQRLRSNGLRVVPIVLSPCNWQQERLIRDLQVLPRDERPITLRADPDEAFVEVCREIVALMSMSDAMPPSAVCPALRAGAKRPRPLPKDENAVDGRSNRDEAWRPVLQDISHLRVVASQPTPPRGNNASPTNSSLASTLSATQPKEGWMGVAAATLLLLIAVLRRVIFSERLLAKVSSTPLGWLAPVALPLGLLAIVVWLIIAWRTQRNRQLLEHLEKLLPADRLSALEMEMGAASLSIGLTPEHWLRARMQLHSLIKFIAMVSALILLTLALMV